MATADYVPLDWVSPLTTLQERYNKLLHAFERGLIKGFW